MAQGDKITGVTPPPKANADGAPKADAPPRPAKRAAPGAKQLHGQLVDLYVSIGTIAVTPIDPLAGALFVARSDELAQTWIDLAETNPKVKKALQKLVEAGGWGGVVIAHGMLLMPVLANRGLFPDHVAGPAAAMTVLQNPEVGPLFTHERFRQPNGNGAGA